MVKVVHSSAATVSSIKSSSSTKTAKRGGCIRLFLLSSLFTISIVAILRTRNLIQPFQPWMQPKLLLGGSSLPTTPNEEGDDEEEGGAEGEVMVSSKNNNNVRVEFENPQPFHNATTEFGPVIHIIQTRFMQFQPNLTELGLARVLLFETFCLPTLLQQSSQNYFWMIRVDPMLHDTVRRAFLKLVQPYPNNIYVIASNRNPEGFRSSRYMADIDESRLWNGNWQLLLQAHAAAQSRVVLETRLDADDGLYRDFVRNIQREAMQHLSSSSSSSSLSPQAAVNTPLPPTWKLWCVNIHLDWQLVSPWKEFDPPSGILSGVKPPLCITPGLTVGYSVNTTREDYPGGAHHLLHKKIPECHDNKQKQQTKNTKKKEGEEVETSENNDQMENREDIDPLTTNCLERFPKSTFSAIRARTVTSAGMADVVLEGLHNKLSDEEIDTIQKRQDDLWTNNMKQLFGITKAKVTTARKVMQEKLATIASENLKGQCIVGFTCKDSSQQMLKQVVVAAKGNVKLKNDKSVLQPNDKHLLLKGKGLKGKPKLHVKGKPKLQVKGKKILKDKTKKMRKEIK